MNEFVHAVSEGFVAPFVLAAAIVVSIVGGAWRMFSRLVSAFIRNEPLPVAPGKTIRLR